MELYTETSYRVSEIVTRKYSTSFSASTRLFDGNIRPHIYAIYGLVRIADEVVDTYNGTDRKKVIQDLRQDLYGALERTYSTNPVIHAFVLTARQYGIDTSLIDPFFDSMMMDLQPAQYTDQLYKDYIYGSAEVIGLMCLRVFCQGDIVLYGKLEKGASALGAAYQKVNFLRDMAGDYRELGRLYFPGVKFETFNESDKQKIVADIEKDFALAKKSIHNLPNGSRRAVQMSVVYYEALLTKLKNTSPVVIKQKRIRINDVHKFLLYVGSLQRNIRHDA